MLVMQSGQTGMFSNVGLTDELRSRTSDVEDRIWRYINTWGWQTGDVRSGFRSKHHPPTWKAMQL